MWAQIDRKYDAETVVRISTLPDLFVILVIGSCRAWEKLQVVFRPPGEWDRFQERLDTRLGTNPKVVQQCRV